MNRRDLLKQAGIFTVGLPALGASGRASMSQAATQDLMVSFDGPFCFWAQDNGGLIAMAPRIGPAFSVPHQAWIATHQNEMQLPDEVLVPAAPAYELVVPGPHGSSHDTGGASIFTKPQDGNARSTDTLFTISVPAADVMVGTRPTLVSFSAGQPKVHAAGLTLLYRNVDLTGVQFNLSGEKQPVFTPCFGYDAKLSVATLAIHLAQINQARDKGHKHAKAVWGQMMAMFKWLETEYGQIDFPPFDIVSCPPGPAPASGAATTRGQKGGQPLFGPGNDCEVPIMSFSTGGNPARRKR